MATGIVNHQMTAAQALTGKIATPAASGTSSKSSTTSDSASITSNDFLTLLVTEMKNQDPTADVDPNAYINQLVNVNSLEQLISINKTLTTDLGSSSSTASTQVKAASTSATAQSASSSTAATIPNAIGTAASKLAPGNLSIPADNPAAERIATSLSRRPSVQ